MLKKLIKNYFITILINKCYCSELNIIRGLSCPTITFNMINTYEKNIIRSLSCPTITFNMINTYEKSIKKHVYDNSNVEKISNSETSFLQKDYNKLINKSKEKIMYLKCRERYNIK